MLTSQDIGWAAGFLEGEAYFASSKNSPCVRADQVQREPLEKLHRLLGGTLRGRTPRKNQSPYFMWQVWGAEAAAVMMTVYPLMSSKRQRSIREALAVWRLARIAPKFMTVCLNGHPFDRIDSLGRRICKRCRNRISREWLRKKTRERREAATA